MAERTGSSSPRTPRPRTIPDALAEVTGFLVTELARSLREKTADAVGELDLRPRQLGLLFVLRDAGPMPQQELGERVGMDRTTVMQFVLELEGARVLARTDHPEDGRAYQVSLTAHGHRLARAAYERVQRVERETLDVLSASERKTFKGLLRRLLAAEPSDDVRHERPLVSRGANMAKSTTVTVQNVNVPGRTSQVDAAKYEAMRQSILKATPSAPPGLTAKEMIAKITPLLPEALWPGGDKIGWWQKTVQLDLEAKGVLRREKDSKPMRWYQL